MCVETKQGSAGGCGNEFVVAQLVDVSGSLELQNGVRRYEQIGARLLSWG